MIVIQIYKAQGLRNKFVEPATIQIWNEIPACSSLEEDRIIYEKEAGTLAKVLFDALPGGVIDALLLEFLSRKRSLLAIPHATQSQESGS
jgi:hypothetical protein